MWHWKNWLNYETATILPADGLLFLIPYETDTGVPKRTLYRRPPKVFCIRNLCHTNLYTR